MAKRVSRYQEHELAQMIIKSLQKLTPPTNGILERPEGLSAVQLSIADRIDEIAGWLEGVLALLKDRKASKVELNKLVRLDGLVRDGMVVLIYSAHTLMKQRLEILHLQQQLERLKKQKAPT